MTHLVKPSDDLAAIVEKARDGTVVVLAPGTHRISGRPPHGQGVLIQNKKNLVITGQGRSRPTIRLGPNTKFGFYIGSNVRNLRIQRLHIRGTPPLRVNTHAIGNYSGTTNVRSVRFTDLRVEQVAVGISVGTSPSGVYHGVTISGNVLADITGTAPGWGYGIHSENATNVSIRHNVIERASRHSIYLARARKGAKIAIQDNLILNHNLSGEQPRWYCAALVCSRASDVRIAHNVILNPRAIAISVEEDEVLGWPTSDVVLLGNRILDAQYVGIWLTTGKTHEALGNSILLHPRPPRKEWCVPTSSFHYPRGKPTSSGLRTPRARWTDADHVAELDGRIYVLNDGVLDRVVPYSWKYQACPRKWQDVSAMAGVPDAAGKGKGRLYLASRSGLYEVDGNTWRSRRYVGDYARVRAMTAASGYVFLLTPDALYRFTPGTGRRKDCPGTWAAVRWVQGWAGSVYVGSDTGQYRVDAATLRVTKIE